MTTDLTHQPAHVQLQALDRREISSRELLDLHLDRIDASHVNAVVTRDDDAARTAARAADERRARNESRGTFDGLPLTIKDSFETAACAPPAAPRTWRVTYPHGTPMRSPVFAIKAP